MLKVGTNKYISKKQEDFVAAEIGGRRVIASGALPGLKGDVRNDKLLLECKITRSNSFSLNLRVWNKIREEAVRDGLRIPIMCIDLLGGEIRKAVFQKNLISEERFKNLIPETSIKSNRISFLIRPDSNLIFTYAGNQIPKNNKIQLCVIPWEDFLVFLKEENLLCL